MTRDSLAKALYCRTVATIVRRANSLKRLGSTLGTLSSDSNESVHNQAEVLIQFHIINYKFWFLINYPAFFSRLQVNTPLQSGLLDRKAASQWPHSTMLSVTQPMASSAFWICSDLKIQRYSTTNGIYEFFS